MTNMKFCAHLAACSILTVAVFAVAPLIVAPAIAAFVLMDAWPLDPSLWGDDIWIVWRVYFVGLWLVVGAYALDDIRNS